MKGSPLTLCGPKVMTQSIVVSLQRGTPAEGSSSNHHSPRWLLVGPSSGESSQDWMATSTEGCYRAENSSIVYKRLGMRDQE